MLVLSRKLDETIYIRDDIVITVLSIRGKSVRLGIMAPEDVPVRRSELLVIPAPREESVASSLPVPEPATTG